MFRSVPSFGNPSGGFRVKPSHSPPRRHEVKNTFIDVVDSDDDESLPPVGSVSSCPFGRRSRRVKPRKKTPEKKKHHVWSFFFPLFGQTWVRFVYPWDSLYQTLRRCFGRLRYVRCRTSKTYSTCFVVLFHEIVTSLVAWDWMDKFLGKCQTPKQMFFFACWQYKFDFCNLVFFWSN